MLPLFLSRAKTMSEEDSTQSSGEGPEMIGQFERNKSLVQIAQELERQRTTSLDFVHATRNIKAFTHEPTGIGSAEEFPPKPELRLDFDLGAGGKFGRYPLTRHGHNQLALKCGIPIRYYWAMIQEGMTDLTAENVNAWLEKQADQRLIRILDGRVRAILSDRYRPLDNYDLAFQVMERAKEHEAEIIDASLTPTKLYIKVTVPQYREEVKAGDPYVPGLVVSNSEVGDGAFTVEPFMWRLVCKNGLIGPMRLYKIHLGGRLQLGELIFKDETKQKMDEALWAQVRDTIDATFSPKIFKAFMDQIRDAEQIPLDKVEAKEILDSTVKDLFLSDQKRLDLIKYWGKEGDTVCGFVNGVTRLAQDFEGYDHQVRAERYAGKLLEARVPSAK
jgi:hypothetical protein